MGRPLGVCSRIQRCARLLDHQLHVGPAALVVQDRDAFEAHHRLEDFTRLDRDEGASCLSAHTKSLKCLRLIRGDPRTGGTPLKSEEPLYRVR
jgi:hypothetical protein